MHVCFVCQRHGQYTGAAQKKKRYKASFCAEDHRDRGVGYCMHSCRRIIDSARLKKQQREQARTTKVTSYFARAAAFNTMYGSNIIVVVCKVFRSCEYWEKTEIWLCRTAARLMWLLLMLLFSVAVAHLLLLFLLFFVVQIASVYFPALLRLFSTFILAEGNYSRLIRSSILSAVVFIDIVLSLFLFKLVWMLPTDRSNDGEKCRCVRLVVWIGTSIVCS